MVSLLAAVATAGPASAVTSQGAFRIGADALWSSGHTGAGETVAVLDMGFGALDESIAAGELPPRDQLELVSFDIAYGLDGRTELGGPTQHGVRMAEIVRDVAPAARLVLVNYHSPAEFLRAVDYIVGRGIPIVSHSNSFLDGPFDGTGPAARAVDAAAAAGILWVNSAGNFAQRHWRGRADVPVAIPLATKPADWLDLHLSWRTPDARAEMMIESSVDGVTWSTVRTSTLLSTQSAAIAPLQIDTGQWRIVVGQTAGAPADLELFSGSVTLGTAAVPASSVATPGDAAGALTVGAVPWTGDRVAPYSSVGPTDDGRPKPDVVAPTYVVANRAWPGTAGTSAATAHVAGAAALLRQQRRAQGLAYAPTDLRTTLVATALDRGEPGVDDEHGAGAIRLDTVAPTVRLRPRRTPAGVRVDVRDAGTVEDLQWRLGGGPWQLTRRPALSIAAKGLSAGRHRVSVVARDMSGNRTAASAWLTIRRPR